MNRSSFFIILTAFVLGFCSCADQPSKQYRLMEEEVNSIEKEISGIEDCDELQMLNFAIMGLRSDLENLEQGGEIPETELEQLTEMVDGLEAMWNGKWAVLDCEEKLGNDELDTSGEEAGYEDYDIL